MSPKTILIVDDSVFDRALLLKALNIKGGFKTLEASSAVQCLVLLEEQKVDLILMDIMMPGIQGNKTLESSRITDYHGYGQNRIKRYCRFSP